MSSIDAGMTLNADGRAAGVAQRFFRTVLRLMLHPGDFYEETSMGAKPGSALLFLGVCSLLYSALASIFSMDNNLVFAAIFFLNAMVTPFVLALILYTVNLILCRGVFKYKTLLCLTAYANVTLLVAWIPGLSWMTGLWRFYLIGVGMVKAGHVTGARAFLALLITGAVLILLLQLMRPVINPLI